MRPVARMTPWLVVACLSTACLIEYEVVTGGSASDGPASSGTTGPGGTDSGDTDSGASGSGSTGAPCTNCDGKCVDLTTDDENCGACGFKCDSDARCSEGKCAPTCAVSCDGGVELCAGDTCICKPGLERCDGQCVNLQTDPMNCGACGGACAEVPCGEGKCQAEGCGELQKCEMSCVDLASDSEHCGACGTSCAVDEFCIKNDCRRVAVSDCARCPCPECDDGARCCDLETFSVALCVEADECPEA